MREVAACHVPFAEAGKPSALKITCLVQLAPPLLGQEPNTLGVEGMTGSAASGYPLPLILPLMLCDQVSKYSC